ncbi:hypothetical protein ASD25_05290 [Brevundimonas sp. Root1423]|nr:hypothetical protein ASD25_05290 [Brevundimonas sp. Root1423]
MVTSEPPLGIRREARLATSTKLKAEMFMASRKLSRLVFSTKLPFSSSLLAKATEWTTKSIVPKAFSSSAKAASMEASSVTSAWISSLAPTLSASGRTRRSSPSPR